LRVEDIDSARLRAGAVEDALTGLAWLGLHHDGEPLVQSARLARHEAALDALKRADLVYPCTCTRGDILAAASAPHAGEEVTYPGTCAHRRASAEAGVRASGKPFAWRFRVSRSPAFVDRVAGFQQLDLARAGGDFVVWKNAGGPAYQLAVVVDDAAQLVTEVVRGDDLIPSTPRQLLLYEALGLAAPSFAHVPLVLGEDGKRLAKRNNDTHLSALRAAGVTPEAVVGLLAWSCGWLPEVREVRAEELVPRFDLGALPRAPFVLTHELLTRIGFAP
jgi:glutamyl-tRNA synthetase